MVNQYQVKIIFFISILCAYFTSGFCGDEQFPTDELTGTWQGKWTTFFKCEENSKADTAIGDTASAIIHIKKNRGWFGKFLKMKTDYIIKNGYLEGAIAPCDTIVKHKFTIPFNLKNDTIRSSVMLITKFNVRPLYKSPGITFTKMETSNLPPKEEE